MKSMLIEDTTREKRGEIIRGALWGDCAPGESSAPAATTAAAGGKALAATGRTASFARSQGHQ